jgi:Leucine-rich repeat (LRR) protein
MSFVNLGNELEVTGNVRNLSPTLWTLSQLTILYLNDNQLTRLPSEIACLTHLVTLDLSNNKLRNLPSEIGKSRRNLFVKDGCFTNDDIIFLYLTCCHFLIDR